MFEKNMSIYQDSFFFMIHILPTIAIQAHQFLYIYNYIFYEKKKKEKENNKKKERKIIRLSLEYIYY